MQLKHLQTGRHCRVYLLSEGRNCPAGTFLEDAATDHETEFDKLVALLDHSCEHRPPRNKQKVRHLEDGIFEFKTGGGLRLLWFWDEGRMVICTHGFVKKQQKTPKGEIETAKKWKRAYREAKKRENIEVIDE